MAVIDVVETVEVQSRGRSIRHLWEAMGGDDTGDPVEKHEFVDRSIQVTGTFGGAAVAIEGSNDGVNYVTLNDLQGDALSFTGAGLKGIAEPTRYIRPQTTGGAGSDIDVTLFGKYV